MSTDTDIIFEGLEMTANYADILKQLQTVAIMCHNSGDTARQTKVLELFDIEVEIASLNINRYLQNAKQEFMKNANSKSNIVSLGEK